MLFFNSICTTTPPPACTTCIPSSRRTSWLQIKKQCSLFVTTVRHTFLLFYNSFWLKTTVRLILTFLRLILAVSVEKQLVDDFADGKFLPPSRKNKALLALIKRMPNIYRVRTVFSPQNLQTF